MEAWKTVVGFPGYEVSSLGRLRSWRPFKRSKAARTGPLVLRGWKAPNGYVLHRLSLGDAKIRKIVATHRMVLEAFAGPCPDGMEGCHCNGVRSDNRAENLRWDTRKNNHADKLKHVTDQSGPRHWTALRRERRSAA